MNYFPMMVALVAARQANDSSADAGRIALASMVVKPPMLGAMLGVFMAKQAAPAPAALAANTTTTTTTTNTNTSQGASLLKQVAPEPDLHSFVPSFIELTRNQAQEFANVLGLPVHFVEGSDGPKKVTRQEPGPGGNWSHDLKVTLHLG